MPSRTNSRAPRSAAAAAPPSCGCGGRHVGSVDNVVPHHTCLLPSYMDPGRKSPVDQILRAAATGDLRKLKKLRKELLKKGQVEDIAEIKDSKGRGLLHIAARMGWTNICHYLVHDLKFPLHERDAEDTTPLLQACWNGYLDTAEYLIDSGADPNALQRHKATCLHMATQTGQVEVMRLLLSKGLDVNASSDLGTPLQMCRGRPDVVKVLLDHGANPNVFTDFHHAPLLLNMLKGSMECTMFLIQAGADPNCISLGCTALSFAASTGNVEIIKCLLEAGADPNIPNDLDLKPIETAALNGHYQVVEILFPVTSPIPACSDWSICGIVKYMQSEKVRKQVILKDKENHFKAISRGDDALRKEEHWLATLHYTLALMLDSKDAIAFSKRSLCYAHAGYYELALSDGHACIKLKPKWPEAYLRTGVALSLLKEFDKAEKACMFGLKLDPENIDLQNALQEVAGARRKSAANMVSGC